MLILLLENYTQNIVMNIFVFKKRYIFFILL